MKTFSLQGKNHHRLPVWWCRRCSETDDPWISAYGRTSSRGTKRQRNSLSFALQSFSPFSENIVEKRITTQCSATSRRYEQLEKSTVSGVLNRTCACVCVCIENQIFTLDTVLDTMPEANNIL